MEILQLVGLGLVVTVWAVVLRQNKPELALFLSIMAGVVVFLAMLGPIGGVVDVLRQVGERAQVSDIYLGTILKIVGIAYLADFGAQVCRDAGEGAIAGKIEFAAKILVLVLAVPIVVAMLNTLLRLLP
ncbi:stage III sporulation protein AD [Desulfurispora thermophila]|uniref:stage III sporulation protein AD n=1 Tax=Desulfurispora thermophila TaxID=265470 RepID=UPI00036225B4|nr:stage III sporulation protein AD [Desulfurispora thermophila]